MTKNYNCFGSDRYVLPKNEVLVPVNYSPPEPRSRRTSSKFLNFFVLLLLIVGSRALGQTYTIGSGTATTTTSGITPFGTLYEDGRMQYLYLASELTAAGMTAGNYVSMAFNFTSLGSPAPGNASVSIGATAATTLAALNTTDPLTTVYSPGTITPVIGWNTWAMSVPFSWDGTSNVLVQVCFDNTAWSANYGVQVTQFASGVSRTYGFYDDGTTGCTITSGNVATAGNRRNRPNIQFTKAASSAPACASGLVPADVATGVVKNPTLTWSAAVGATSYDVYFGTTATPVFAANVTGTSYTPAAPLASNSQFFWRVVPKNGIGPASGCAVLSFTTGTGFNYCLPVTTYGCADGDVIARVILNTLDNNSGTGCPSDPTPGSTPYVENGEGPGYSDYTNTPGLTTTLQAGTSYSCTVYAGQWSEGYAAWIDYNDDGIFDNATERIGFSNGTVAGSGSVGVLGASATFPIVLSCSPPVGQHRLRVRAMFNTNGSAVTPCGDNSYGEVEDYIVEITAADPCPVPNTVASSGITQTNATFTWAMGCVETLWEAAIVPAGSGAPASGTEVSETTFSTTTLSAGTDYDFYVRSACDPENSLYSSWVGPLSFSTLENVPDCPASLDAPADAATGVVLGAGVTVSWTAPAAGAPVASYDVYRGTTSGSLSLIGNTTETSYTFTGLTFNTTYFWSVRPKNDGGAATGCQEFSFTTEPAPAYDLCSGALSLDAMTSPFSGTTAGLGHEFTPSCSSGTAPDIFLTLTVQPGYTLEMSETNSYDSVVSVFYGDCTNNTSIICFDDPDDTVVTWENTTGSAQTVYWVQDGWSGNSGDFTLSWTITPPPVDITGFAPASVCGDLGGDAFTIAGSNFTGADAVYFNGIAATSFTVVDDATITAVSPAGDIAGPITVYKSPSSNGFAASAENLIVYPLPVVEPITGGDTTICIGGTVDLDSASPGGTWSSDNTDVATVDAAGIVTGVSAGQAVIAYSVTDNGCTTAVTTTIDVSAPIQSNSPGSQVVVTGDDASFSVAATGDIASYQWYVSTDFGDTFAPVAEAAPYSGTTTNTLMITATPASFNDNVYYVVITPSGPCPSFQSDQAFLNVGDTGIATHPSSVSICDSGSGEASFTVVPTGNDTTTAWEVFQGSSWDPVVDGSSGNVTYSGATTNTLTVSGIVLANSGWLYRAVVTGPDNTIYSNNALLTVSQGVSITTDPASASVCYTGGTASFAATTSGTVTGYQWQYSTNNVSFSNVVNNTPAGTTYAGATSANLMVTTTASTPAAGTYYYRMVAIGSASCGNANSLGAQLSIFTPAFTTQPAATTAIDGLSSTMTVSSAAPGASYQWQYSANGTTGWASVANGTPAGITYSGGSTATLTINPSGAASGAAGFYRAVLTSNGCSKESNSAALTIAAYCTSVAANAADEEIYNVTFNGASTPAAYANSNSCSAVAPGAGSILHRYSNFTGSSLTTVTQGTSVPFSVFQSECDGELYYANGIGVWIDFNRDGDFNDAGEAVFIEGGTAAGPRTVSGNIAIPINATPGTTRMRVIAAEGISGAGLTPCLAYDYGETEDYTVTIQAAPACTGNPMAGTVTSSAAAVCGSGSVTLTASGYSSGVTGLSFQWYNTSTGAILGATSPTYTTPVISTPTSYFFRVTCANGGSSSDSNTVTININNPTVTGTTPGSRCGTGTVALGATASPGATLNWYANATGGLPLYSGTNFTTPSIAATTNFYVEATIGGSSGTAGLSGPSQFDNGANTGNHGLSITTTVPGVTINSVSIPFTGTGTITIALKNSSNTTVISSYTSPTLTGTGSTPLTIPLGITIANPGNYLLIVNSVSGSVGALGYSSTSGFPYSALGGGFQITSSYWYGSDTANYLYLYNVQVSNGCNSARTAVTATVDTPPAFTLSGSTATICEGQTTPAVTIASGAGSYDTFSWSPSTGVSGDAGSGYTFSPTVTTVYTLTASSSTSGCANTATYNVTVNPLPDMFAVTPSSVQLCSTDAPVSLTTLAPAPAGCLQSGNGNYPSGTFTSSNCNGTAVTTITTLAWAGEYSNVGVTANTKYVFTSTGAGDYVTISNAAGTVVLAYGPSPLTYIASAAATVRFYSQIGSCSTQNVSRTRSFVCSPAPSYVWSPVAGLFTDAAGTIPYSGGAATTVYAKPTATTTYTATATSSSGCVRSSSATINVSQAVEWFVDADGDNYGNSALPTVMACSQPSGYAALGGDCDDNIAAVNPGHAEVLYNGVDDNCDGQLDEGNQILSQVLASQCGTTLTSISSLIGAVSKPGATAYRFKVINQATSAEEIIVRTVPNFSLTMLASYDYAATYSVSVEVQRNGVWLGYYGPSCLVSTPAILDPGGSAAVSPSQCGIVLPSISTLIATTSIPNVTGYRFRVTNLTDATAPNEVQILDRTLHWFSLTMLTRFNYGTTYQVEVAVKTNGAYSGFGAPCTVSSPAVPMLTDCGAVISSAGALVTTTSMNRATAYRFEITNLSSGNFEQITVDRSSNWFTFNNVPGFEPGGLYAVRVALQTSGFWSPFSEACEITAPGAARTVVKGEEATPAVTFRAVVYPNPYVESFALDMDTSSEEKVQVKVYDMVGKLLEDREFEVDMIEMQQFGERYPSGVYNIVVTQASFVKTLRVIKR